MTKTILKRAIGILLIISMIMTLFTSLSLVPVSATTGDKMFYIKYGNRVVEFASETALQPGSRYTFTCKMKHETSISFSSVSDLFIHFWYAKDSGITRLDNSVTPSCNFVESYDASTYTYTASFTFPTDAKSSENFIFKFGEFEQAYGGQLLNFYIADLALTCEGTQLDVFPEISEENTHVSTSRSYDSKYRVPSNNMKYGTEIQILDKGNTFDKAPTQKPSIPSDLVEVFADGEWSCFRYTKGWSTIKAGNYRFEMDCKIFSGSPIIRVGTDGNDSTAASIIDGYQSNYKATYDAENFKYVITFTMDSDWGGNLGLLIGNYGQSDPAHFACASPTLYLLDANGNPTGDSLITSFLSENYSTSRAGNKWNRRNIGAGLLTCTNPVPDGYFSATEEKPSVPSDLIEITDEGEWSCLRYTKGWSTIKAGNYRFEMDCKIFSGTPVIRVGTDGNDTTAAKQIEGYQSNYVATYDEKNYKYIITFTMDSDWEGNLGALVGNYGQDDLAHFACASPTLYLLDADGKPTGESLINSFLSEHYSSERKGNMWNRRNMAAGIFTCTNPVPDGYFSPEATVPEIASDLLIFSDTETWNCLQYTKSWSTIKAGNYRFEMDCKVFTGEPTIRVGNDVVGTLIDGYQSKYDGYYDEDKCKYIITFTMDQDWEGNLGVLVGNYGYASSFACARPALYRLDADGKITGSSLIVSFLEANYSTARAGNKWCRKNFSSGRITFETTIPDGYFTNDEASKTDPAIGFENTEGSVAQFVTLKPNTSYRFIFNYKSDNGAKATPYIEAFSDAGSLGNLAVTYVSNDANGKYSYSCEFKTPANLASENNVRIGIAAKATDVVYASGFELYELDYRYEVVSLNLISDSELAETATITAYDGTPSDKWTFVGTEGMATIKRVAKNFFVIPVPQVFMFAGQANDRYITHTSTLTAGKSYQISFNLKYGSKGYDGDTGVAVKYNDGSAWKTLTLSGGKVNGEYKEVYTFDLPADARDAKNLQFSVKVGSPTVTGYLANLYICDLTDPDTNLAVNGDFSNSMAGWSTSGLGVSTLAPLPDGYFSEDGDYTKGMIAYRNAGTWDNFMAKYLTLKSETYYLLVAKNVHPWQPVDKSVYAFQVSGTENGDKYQYFLDTISYKQIGNTYYRLVKTPAGLATTGNTYFRMVMQGGGNAGYWGEFALYESNANMQIMSENVMLNTDFALGMANWTPSNTDGFTWRLVEQPEDFFETYSAHNTNMITSQGTKANAELGQVITVERGKTYYFSGFSVNMNAAGITPKVYLKDAKGNWVDSETQYIYDTDRFFFEMVFTLPDDAYSLHGKAEAKFVLTNGKNGKAHISDVAVYEEGKYENLFKNANYSKNLNGWISNSNYKIEKYDSSVFVFYYDDEKFNDGNWSGEGVEGLFTHGEISGRVFDESGMPIVGLQMVLKPGNKQVKTDTEGYYIFKNLNEGNYKLYTKAPDGTLLYVKDLSVKAGINSSLSVLTLSLVEAGDDVGDVDNVVEDVTVSEDESGKYGIVRGYLYDADASLIKNAKVYLGDIATQVTDENGMFEFKDVPPGKYSIYTKDSDGEVYILKDVEVLAGKGAVYKLQLPAEEQETNWIMIIIIGASALLLLVVSGIVALLVIKKKKIKK